MSESQWERDNPVNTYVFTIILWTRRLLTLEVGELLLKKSYTLVIVQDVTWRVYVLSWWLFSICAVSSEVFGWVQMTSLCGCLQNTVAVKGQWACSHVQSWMVECWEKSSYQRFLLVYTPRREERRRFFVCHIHNYTEYNQQWNLCSAFNPSKCTHTQSSGKPTGSSWGFGALLKGLTSVVVLKVERTLVIHSPPSTIPAGAEIRTHNLGLQVWRSIH